MPPVCLRKMLAQTAAASPRPMQCMYNLQCNAEMESKYYSRAHHSRGFCKLNPLSSSQINVTDKRASKCLHELEELQTP